MTLPALLAQIGLVVVGMVLAATYLVAGRPRAVFARAATRARDPAVVPYLALLAAVLAVNTVARRHGPDVSWLIGWNLTGTIYGLEGAFVAWVQSFATPPVTTYFAFAYIYGYVFLLVFPLVAYAALEDTAPLRETALAYSLNYAIGLACYLLVVAYGPRNLIPDLVDPLLYSSWPSSQLVTSQVNRHSNVFPSLHTSLSLTVVLLAIRTRDRYPRWLPIAGLLAASITVSTMYLGIHWATDVVAGGALAVLSVAVATRSRVHAGPYPGRVRATLTRWRGGDAADQADQQSYRADRESD